MPSRLLKKLPISIRQNRDPKSNECEFTIKMSWELAEQMSLIAAPFLRELSLTVARHQQKEAENAVRLASLAEEAKRIRYYGLRAIKLERSEKVELLSICEELGFLHDIDPPQLFNAAQMLKTARYKRRTRFVHRRIVQLHASGWKKSQLAEHFGLSRWVIGRIVIGDRKLIASAYA